MGIEVHDHGKKQTTTKREEMSKMSNLLRETISTLNKNGKNSGDVRFVQSPRCSFSWDEFAALADRDYNSGYGGNEVLQELVVVGDVWWLERHEYDGSEWWEYKERPKQIDRGIPDNNDVWEK